MNRFRRPCPRHPERAAAYAYLWLLVLIAIMALGTTASTQIAATLTQRSQERELLAIGHQFREAIVRYHAVRVVASRGEFPRSLDDLVQDDRFPGTVRHLRKVFADPFTGHATWGLVRSQGRIVGVHSLSDRRPIKQDGFKPDDAAFQGRRKISEWVFLHPDFAFRGSESEDRHEARTLDPAAAPSPWSSWGIESRADPFHVPLTPSPPDSAHPAPGAAGARAGPPGRSGEGR